MTMMTPHPLPTIQLPRMLRACIYAVLLCAFFGVVADTRAQSKTDVCDALDMSTADCALITELSTTLPSGVTLPQEGASATVATAVPWLVSSVKTEGDNSMRSGAVSDAEGSCLVLAVSLPATRLIRFSLRTSSQGMYDRLAFFIDDQTVISNFSAPEDSITRDWEQQNFVVTDSVSKLSWCYLKNGGDNMQGDDAGWLDNLSFITPSPVCPILDMSDEECGLITATSYDPSGSAWTANSIATEGSDSLRSRGVSSSQQSCLILNVSLPDRTLVQFSRRVNSQPADELYFSIDDVRQEYSLRPAATAALRDWSREVHILFESGDKVLSWCYVKDASGTEGADRAWIDDLSLIAPPAAPLNRDVVCLVLDMSLEDCELITSYASVPPDPAWYISYFNTQGGTALRSDPAVDDNRFSCLVLGVTLPADTRIGFALRTDSEGGNDFAYFEADGVGLIENYSAPLGSSLRDFEPLAFEVTNPVSNLRWCYQKDAILSVGDDSVWLDRLYFIPPGGVRLEDQLCMALDMSDQDCARITSVSTMPPDDLTIPHSAVLTDVPWRVSNVATEGDSSLRSGNISASQASCLVLRVALPAGTLIHFSLRTDSAGFFSFLLFAADNQVLISNFSAPQGSTLRNWEIQGFDPASSISKLSWCYVKRFRNSTANEDSGWLDDLSFIIPLTEQICLVLDLNAEGCALITGVSTTLPTGLTLPTPPNRETSVPGNVPWFVSSVATEGGLSLRSGDIDHSEASCLVLRAALPANTEIRFSLRSTSEPELDRLIFAADNRVLIRDFSASGSNILRDWEAQEVTLANSVSNLSWCYLKNGSRDFSTDTGWLDALSFTLPSGFVPPLQISQVCATLDMSADDCALITGVSTTLPTGLTLPAHAGQISIPGNVPWFASNVATEGDFSLRSGTIGHSEASCLVLAVALPANTVIRFSLRTNSFGVEDRLVFAAGNQILIQNFSAPPGQTLRDWEARQIILANSVSKLSWCYLKDGSGTLRTDSGWVDDLSFITPPTRDTPLNRDLVCLVLDMSPEDCTLITHVGSDPAAPPWYASTVNSEGDHSLRSDPDIDHNETSCLVLGVALPGDRTIRFFLRTDSEGGNDFLYFEADGTRLIRNFSAPSGSSLRDFEEVNVFLAGDISKLAWCYTKNEQTDAGDDSGWLDRLSFSAAGARTSIALTPGLVCQALDLSTDNCTLIDSVAADPPERPWVLSDIATEGSLSLRSGDIDNSQTSCLVLGITLPADRNLRFSLRTDSEAVNDFLYFEADGTRMVDTFAAAEGSTVRDWEQLDILISDSISSLKWCYTKNGSTSAGEDSGWLDALTFTVLGVTKEPLCTTLDMSAGDCALISTISTILPPGLMLAQPAVDVPWTVSRTVGNQGGSSLRSGDIDHSEASCLVLGVTLPTASLIRFSLRAGSEGFFDHLTFAADSQTVIENFSHPLGANTIPTSFEPQEYRATNRISHLSWCYQKNTSINMFSDAGWLDTLSFAVPVSLSKTQLCTALDLSTDNCSQIQSLSFDPPSFPWRIATDTSVAGGTSLRSGEIDDNQQSCLVLDLSLSANSVITLASRTSSQGGFDQLQVSADPQHLDTLSAATGTTEKPWAHTTYYLRTAATELRWCYVKDSADSDGEDRVWIDKLSFSASGISYKSRICDALDMTEALCLLLSNIRYSPTQMLWGVTSQTSVLGGTSLRSPDIGGGRACLAMDFGSITLPAGTLIRFSLRTDSEAVNDQLEFVGGAVGINRFFSAANESLSNWEPQEIRFPNAGAGFLTHEWCYQKSENASSGAARGWLDAFSIPTPLSTEDVCLALDLSDEECTLITGVATEPPQSLWLISPIATEGDTALRSDDIDDDQQSCLVLNLSPLVERTLVQFSLRASSEPMADRLVFSADGQFLDSRLRPESDAVLRDWSRELYIVPADTASLSWCYIKNNVTSSGEDSIWIDDLSITSTTVAVLTRELVCLVLDIDIENCGIIRSVAFEPPASPWLISPIATVSSSSLRSADIDDSESSCLVLGIALSVDSGIRFSLRTDSEAVNDHLSFEAGSQELIETFAAAEGSDLRDWEPQQFLLAAGDSNLRWCYNKNDSTSSGADSGWLDALSFVNAELVQFEPLCDALDLSQDRCAIIRSVTYNPPQSLWLSTATESARGGSALVSPVPGSGESSCLTVEFHSPLTPGSPVAFDWRTTSQSEQDILQFQVGVQQSQIAGMSEWQTETVNFNGTESALRWCYNRNSAADAQTARGWLDNLSVLTLTDRYTLEIITSTSVTQSAPDAMIVIAVTVAATDNFGEPLDLTGLILMVEDAGNADVSQSNYALGFVDGSAETSITVGLTRRGDVGSIELSVVSGDIQSTVSITLNPAPRALAAITLSAASSNLAQTTANTTVAAVLMLTALDNYGDPIEAGDVNLQIEATNAAIVVSSLTVAIATTATVLQMIEILPQNELDTTVTVSILRGTLDESIQLLPDSGIQIAVRALRVLRQLQLSLVDQVSPLQQIDSSLPIRANIRLNGLDQFGQPIAFSEVMLTATAEPTETAAVLEPPQLTATGPEGARTQLVVTFPDDSPMETMIIIAIIGTGGGVTTNSLLVQALPDPRDPLQPLHVDATATGVTELDLIVALRWLIDQQGDNNASLVVNLTIPSADITEDGIDNLRQLFTESGNLDRVDLNRDGRADQLDLRILLRYLSGLRGAELAEQDVFEDLIRRLLNRQP